MAFRRILACLACLAALASGCSDSTASRQSYSGASPATTAAPVPKPLTTPAPAAPAPTTTPVTEDSMAGVGDSFYPLLGNGGYDVAHYDIELEVAASARDIDAQTTLTAVATEDLPRFNLDFFGLEVEAVTVNGVEAQFSRDGQEMTIQPADPIPAGMRFTVAVSYKGTPKTILDPALPYIHLGWTAAMGTSFTVNEPSGAMTWYPSNNHPSDKATFTFRITVPEGVTAAATGVLTAETTTDGSTTTTWEMDDPMATYLAAVYVGDFERHERRLANGLLIRDYVPRDADPVVLEDLKVAPEAIAFFEEILGPYPFDAYGTIVMPFALGYAFENQTLSIHGQLALDPYIIAHEVAHQWLGNSVTVDDWSHIWLHEGFAHYLGLIFIADFNDQGIDDIMVNEHREVALIGTSPPGDIEPHELFDFETVYRRGALTLHALRLLVGDEQFFDIVRTHYDQAAGGNTNTDLFLGVVRDIAGADAVSLVESWLFDSEISDLSASGASSS